MSSRHARRTTTIALGALAGILLGTPAGAQPVRNLAGFRTNTLQANDDGSTGAVATGFANPLDFFGLSFPTLYVNNNGNVTFSGPLSTFTPFGLTTSLGTPIIAPFFADVDTRGPSLSGSGSGGGNVGNVPQPFDGSGLVTYGNDVVGGRPAFGVDWFSDCAAWTGGAPGPTCSGLIGDGYFAGHTDKLNVFQLVLIDRSDIAAGDFDFEFNYNTVLWETGDASGGSGGFGGRSAHAGYSNGTGAPGTNFELAGSGVNGALIDGGPNALVSRSNVGVPGRYLFTVRSGAVTPPVLTPEPATVALTAAGLLALAGVARRRREG